MATLGDRLAARDNNFDAIRLLAAALVIVSHSFALSGHEEPAIAGVTLGTIAVAIFFITSGFLITHSWYQHPRVGAFIGKRVLRIMPGFAVALAFTIFVVGPAYTVISRSAYFTSSETKAYEGGLFLYTMGATLPGVFNDNPLPQAVNGSLWTLPYEFTAYLMVALLGALTVLRRNHNAIILLAVLIPSYYLLHHFSPDAHLPFFNLDANALIRLSIYFTGGILLYVYRVRIPLSKTIALIALATLIYSALYPPLWLYASFIALPYLTLFAAFSKVPYLNRAGRFGDMSYGLYIYAFPVQQMIVANAQRSISPYLLILLSLPITLILAFLSWHFVEAPALRYKHLFSKERYPILTPPEPEPRLVLNHTVAPVTAKSVSTSTPQFLS